MSSTTNEGTFHSLSSLQRGSLFDPRVCANTVVGALSAITHNPWDVHPGTYDCANGHTQYLGGRDHFWDANIDHGSNTASKTLACHAAETVLDSSREAGGEEGTTEGQAATKERREEALRGLIVDGKGFEKTE
jgi:hypothetical protein